MLNAAFSLPIGNAVRVLFCPPAGAGRTRILRRPDEGFTGWNDTAAVVVYDGEGGASAVDAASLANGTTYFYAEYDYVNAAWVGGAPILPATPETAYQDASVNVLAFLRERLAAGLKAAVAAGTLAHDNNYIPVLSAPPLFENTKWPVVSLHLRDDTPAERGIGEVTADPVFDPVSGEWVDSEGWLSRVQIHVIGWSLNADQRIVLRQALKAVVIGNLPVFDAAGMQTVNFMQSDDEEMERYNAPVYMTVGTFSCLAPSIITFNDPSGSGPTEGVTVDGYGS